MALFLTGLLSFGRTGLSLEGGAVCVVGTGGDKLTGIERRVQEDESANPRAVADAVRSAVQAARAGNKKLRVSLSSRDSIVRCFFMPWIPRGERKNAVRFQAQKYMPFELESLCYDYEIFEDKKAGRLTVVFMASRRETVNTLMALLSGAGVTVESLEPASLSLARAAFPQTSSVPDQTHAIVAVGDSAVNIVIVKNKILFSSQEVRVPASALAGDPASAAAELSHAFDFFLKSFKGEEIKRVLLTVASGQSIDLWIKALSAELGQTVEALKAPKNATGLSAYTPAAAAATGLVLDRPAGGAKINLLSRETAALESLGKASASAAEKTALRRLVAAEVGLVIGLTFLTLVGLTVISSMETSAIEELVRTRLTPFSADSGSTLAELEEVEAALSKKQKALRVLIEERPPMTQKWSEIARLAPENLVLSTLEMQDYSDNDNLSRRYLSFEGIIYSDSPSGQIATVNGFLTALKQDPAFIAGLAGGKLTQISRVGEGSLGMRFQAVFAEKENE